MVEQQNIIKKIIKDSVTLSNGEDYDIGRILWILGVFWYFGLSIYGIHEGKTFDPLNWGSGFAAILAAGGIALGAKNRTEPKPPEQKDN